MKHVIVGGGVAGVCCAEELCRLLPADEITLLSAEKVLKGVSTIARITKNIEELKVEEKHLDELPYPNLRMVQDVATGIDMQHKLLLLGNHDPLPYDKLCICAGAHPKRLLTTRGSDEASSPYIISLRDTQSLQELCTKLGGSRRVMVVGNGAIALEAVFALRGLEVVWVLKHGHIGDAIFDLDAAQFLLEELQAQQTQQTELQQAQHGAQHARPEERDARWQEGQPPQQQQAQHLGRQSQHEVWCSQQAQHEEHHGASLARVQKGMLGHAVGPTWVAALPHFGGKTRVVLEYGCHVQSITACEPEEGEHAQQEHGCTAGLLHAAQQAQQVWQGQEDTLSEERAQQAEQQQQQGTQLAAHVASRTVVADCVQEAAPRDTVVVARPAGAADSAVTSSNGCCSSRAEASSPGEAPGGGAWPWKLLVMLSNGKRYGVDLVISAIGVTPALGWVPPEVKRGKDGGLLVDRCMETSQPDIYAAGDSCTADWAAQDSPHWFQMRLWTQARVMGLYAAHCMAGLQENTGAGMAFELFTHATRFMGHKVILLGLYNGQRLEGEPSEELVTYSRVTEGPERTFVRVLLLRGRVQGAVLIGDTDLEETMENLILDQLDVGDYFPGLLDPEVELDHVFD